jgi:hypothetical protein
MASNNETKQTLSVDMVLLFPNLFETIQQLSLVVLYNHFQLSSQILLPRIGVPMEVRDRYDKNTISANLVDHTIGKSVGPASACSF